MNTPGQDVPHDPRKQKPQPMALDDASNDRDAGGKTAPSRSNKLRVYTPYNISRPSTSLRLKEEREKEKSKIEKNEFQYLENLESQSLATIVNESDKSIDENDGKVIKYSLSPKSSSTPRADLLSTYPKITIKEGNIKEKIGEEIRKEIMEEFGVAIKEEEEQEGYTKKIEQVTSPSSPVPSPRISGLSKLEELSEEDMKKLVEGQIVWDDELQKKYGEDEHIKFLMELLKQQYNAWKESQPGQAHFSDDSYTEFNKLFRTIVVNFRTYFGLSFQKMLENVINLFIQFNKDYGIDLYDIIKNAKEGTDVHTIRILNEFVVSLLFKSSNGLKARKQRWKEKAIKKKSAVQPGGGKGVHNGVFKKRRNRKRSGGGLWEDTLANYKKISTDFLEIIDIMFSYIDLQDKGEYEELKKQLVYFLCLMLFDYLTPVSEVDQGQNVFVPENVIDRLVKEEKTLGQQPVDAILKDLKKDKADEIETFIYATVTKWQSIAELSRIKYDTRWADSTKDRILINFKSDFETINKTLIDNLLKYFLTLTFNEKEILDILECVYKFIYVNSKSNGNITNRLIRYMIIVSLLIFTCVRDKKTYDKQKTLEIIRDFNQNFIPQQRTVGSLRTGGKLSKKRNSIKDLEKEVKKLNKKALSLFKKKELVKEKIKKIDTKLKELDKKRKELGKQYKKNKTKTLKNQIDKIIKSIEKEKINKVNKKKEMKKISDEYKSKNKELKNKDNALKKKLKKKGGTCPCSLNKK